MALVDEQIEKEDGMLFGKNEAVDGDAPETPELEPEKEVIPKARPKKKAPTRSASMTIAEMMESLKRGEVVEGRSGARLTSITGAFVTVEIGQATKNMHVYSAYKTYVKA